MIKWMLHSMMRRFEKQFDYNADYSHEIIDESSAAAVRLLGLSLLTQFKGPEVSLWAGAGLASVLDGDCGPCAQLVVNQAVDAGVPAELLVACVKRDFEKAGPAGLGFQFAEAVIADNAKADSLRDEIVSRFGKKALIAASYATAGHRTYPVLKRGLGFGKACQSLQIGEITQPIIRATA